MEILYVKSIHIVFVVSWFAALFYIVRLFIYTTEAQKKPEPDKSILTQQLQMMQTKLWYIIGWPAMIGTYVFGFWMIYLNTSYLSMPWMWLKLFAVFALTLYHIACQAILTQQRKNYYKNSSFKLRLVNELATVLLVAIVFLVVVKSSSGMMWGLLGLIIFALALMAAVSIYKRANKRE